MGFPVRGADGRHRIGLEPPLPVPAGDDEAAVVELTARHTARLEGWVRRHPDHWLWLHRRWKTRPGPAAQSPAPQPLAVHGGS
jgi:KDO2-lipid IV(A) lauroyltransferase